MDDPLSLSLWKKCAFDIFCKTNNSLNTILFPFIPWLSSERKNFELNISNLSSSVFSRYRCNIKPWRRCRCFRAQPMEQTHVLHLTENQKITDCNLTLQKFGKATWSLWAPILTKWAVQKKSLRRLKICQTCRCRENCWSQNMKAATGVRVRHFQGFLLAGRISLLRKWKDVFSLEENCVFANRRKSTFCKVRTLFFKSIPMYPTKDTQLHNYLVRIFANNVF